MNSGTVLVETVLVIVLVDVLDEVFWSRRRAGLRWSSLSSFVLLELLEVTVGC